MQRLPIALFLLLLLGPLSSSAQLTYMVKDLGTLGGNNSLGAAVNSKGQVAGASYLPDDTVQHAFITGPNGALPLQDLGTMGGAETYGQAINTSGRVAGTLKLADGTTLHPFLSGQDGIGLIDLGTLGGTNAYAYGVNGAGETAGYSSLPANRVSHAFLSGANGGALADLGTLPGGLSSFGFAVNATGQVAGYSGTSVGLSHAFLSAAHGGALTDLGTLGGSTSFATAVNDAGRVVGRAETTAGQQHAFRSAPNGGALEDLGTLGGSFSIAEGINASGAVVGYSYLSGNATQHAFIFTSAYGIKDLNALVPPGSGITLTDARAINDSGQIAGYGTVGLYTHAFLLLPILPPLAITDVSILDNGAILVRGTGGASQSYGIEATSDLKAPFERIATVIASSTGILEYQDLDAGNFARRFYRFVYP